MDHSFKNLKNTVLVPPYSHISHLYDKIMEHVNYYEWADYIKQIIRQFAPRSMSVCDISCGTGNMAFLLTSFGYHVYGLDQSESMITIAQNKAQQDNQSLSFHVGDMRTFKLPLQVNVILSLYDSVNYLFSQNEFIEMFNSVYHALLPEGLFIFDICTQHNSLKYFTDYRDTGIIDGIRYHRHSYYETETNIQNTEFAVQYANDSTWYIEQHRQKIMATEEVDRHIPARLFDCIGKFDNFTFYKPSARTERIHYILKKRLLSA